MQAEEGKGKQEKRQRGLWDPQKQELSDSWERGEEEYYLRLWCHTDLDSNSNLATCWLCNFGWLLDVLGPFHRQENEAARTRLPGLCWGIKELRQTHHLGECPAHRRNSRADCWYTICISKSKRGLWCANKVFSEVLWQHWLVESMDPLHPQGETLLGSLEIWAEDSSLREKCLKRAQTAWG